MKNNLLVIGSYNVDLSVTIDRFPTPGETLNGKKFIKNSGGKGANQAIAAARLDGNVTFLGCVGDDSFGVDAIKLLQEEKVDTRNIKVEKGIPTGNAIILVDQNGENEIIVTPGANGYLQKEHVYSLEKELSNFNWLLIQCEVPIEVVSEAVKMSKTAGLRIILNPAPMSKEINKIIDAVDILTPNKSELELLISKKLTTDDDIIFAADQVIKQGVKTVIVTLGKKGVYVKSNEFPEFKSGRFISAIETKPIDTTGAGDCFNGALAVALCEEKSFIEALHFAIAASSLSILKSGASNSMPHREEVVKLLGEKGICVRHREWTN